jgi:GTP-binding protein EngB required for normal cell division
MNSEPSTLKDYSRSKLALAGQLRLLREAFKKSDDSAGEKQCEELMVKLAEDRFTLAVLGQFKRGKSSLMNAIIGRELLPTGVLPLTSAITKLNFGPQERLVVEREGLIWPEELPLTRLDDYVTERGNPGNQKRVKSATVEVPVPFLRRGLEFVDTPGVGSAIVANTATTYAFLPQCDAVLFVTSVDTPLTRTELEFLKEIRQHVHKIFFVVNKTDLLPAPEVADVLAFVARTLREPMGVDELRIFPLSCRRALTGQDESGLPALQEELARFLSEEKSATFLDAIAQRVARLKGSETRPVGAPPIVSRAAPPEPTAAMKTRGCPVCDHLYQVVFDFLAQWQYAIATDAQAQTEFAAELGFCPLHTWQMNLWSSPVGASVGYAKLAQRVAQLLKETRDVTALVRDTKTCRVCRLMRDAEKRYAAEFAVALTTAAGRDTYAHSQGVCLRHLALLIAASDNREVADFLRAEAARHFEEAGEDMQSFAMKTDALRRYLRNKDEEDAYLRALSHLAGNRSICVPWPADVEI